MDMNHGKGMAGRLLASGASPVRKLGKASRRLTAWLLAFVVLCGMVPARSVEASEVRKETTSEAGTVSQHVQVAVLSLDRTVEPGDYGVSLTWNGDSPYCTLSEDKTVADWHFTGQPDLAFLKSDMNHMYDFSIDITLHDTDPDDFELRIPAVLYSKQYASEAVGNVQAGDWIEYAIDDAALKNTMRSYDFLSMVSPEGDGVNAADRVYVLRLEQKVSRSIHIPVTVKSYRLSGREADAVRLEDTYGFAELVDGDALSFSVDTGGASIGLTANVKKDLYNLSVTKETAGSWIYTWSGYIQPRIYEWTSGVEEYYGLAKEEFNQATDDGYVFFEYVWKVAVSGWDDGHLRLELTPHESGEVVSFQLGIQPYSSWAVKSVLINNDATMVRTGGNVIDFDVRATGGSNNEKPFYENSARNAGVAMMYGNLKWEYGYTGSVHACALVKYKLSDILPEGSDSTVSSCTLDARLTSARDKTCFTESFKYQITRPKVNMNASGTEYGCDHRIDYTVYSDTILTYLENGARNYNQGAYSVDGFVCNNGSGEASFAVGMLGITAFDPLERKWVLLGGDDYRFTNPSSTIRLGRPVYNDGGSIIDYDMGDVGDDVFDHPVRFEVVTSDRPDEWQVVLRSTYGSWEDDLSKVSLVDMDVIRFRFVDEDRSVPLSVHISAGLRLNGSEHMKTLVQHIRESGSDNLCCEMLAFTGAVSEDGNPLAEPKSVTWDFKESFASAVESALADHGYGGERFPFGDHGMFYLGLDGINATMCMVPTLYGADGEALGPYCDGSVTAEVTAVDWFVASLMSGANPPNSNSGMSLPENSMFNARDAVYRILVPDGMDVVSVEAGKCGAMSDVGSVPAKYWAGGDRAGWTANFLAGDAMNGLSGVFVEFDVSESEVGGGHTVLTVRTHSSCERDQLGVMWFGGFTVRLQPKFANVVLSSTDLSLWGAFYAVTSDGNAVISKKAGIYPYEYCSFLVDDGSYSAYPDVFSDLDRNDTTDERLGTYHAVQCDLRDTPYVSGMSLSASLAGSNLWGYGVTAEPGDSYRYRLTYSQMSETSEDVVLFNSIEDVEGNAWHGTLEYIDLSDADRQGLTYTLYGNAERIDTEAYVGGNFTADGLTEANGWYKLAGLSRSSWPFDVKSIAVDFGGTVFAKDQEGKPSSVRVWLGMSSPAGGYAGDSIPVSNRGFFSDVLVGSGRSRSVMSNVVTVSMDTSVGYGADKTIALSGDVPEGWTAELSGNKLSIDREGMLSGELGYSYTLRYEMDDPGEDKIKSVGSLVLYDEIESGTDSRYAGKLVGIRVSGLTALPWEVPSSDAGGARMNYLDIGLDDVAVFVAGAGIGPDAEQDGTLAEATGRSDWHLLDTGSMDTFLEANDVSAVAVCLGSMATGRSEDAVFRSSYLEVGLDMAHAGRKGATGGDRLLKNGFLLSYIPNGTDAPVKMEYPDKTELEVLYEDFGGLELPKTGGAGTAPYMVTGCSLALLASLALLRRRRYR